MAVTISMWLKGGINNDVAANLRVCGWVGDLAVLRDGCRFAWRFGVYDVWSFVR